MEKTATLGLVKPTHGINVVEGNNLAGVPNEAANLDAIDAAIAALNGAGQGTFLVTAPEADQTVTGGKKIINTGGFQGPVTGDVAGNVTGNVTGNLAGNAQESVSAIKTTNAAITEKQGVVRLGGTGARAMTLADPTADTDDGKRLAIFASTAEPHVITVAGGVNGGNTITLGGAIGDTAELLAIAGKWHLRPSPSSAVSTV